MADLESIERKLDQLLKERADEREQLEEIHRFLEPIAHWMQSLNETMTSMRGASESIPAAKAYLKHRSSTPIPRRYSLEEDEPTDPGRPSRNGSGDE